MRDNCPLRRTDSRYQTTCLYNTERREEGKKREGRDRTESQLYHARRKPGSINRGFQVTKKKKAYKIILDFLEDENNLHRGAQKKTKKKASSLI